MKIFPDRSTQFAALTLILACGFLPDEAMSAAIRGKIVDRCSTIEQNMPSCSEKEIGILAEASGLKGSDVRVMLEAKGQAPAKAPRIASVLQDEKKTPLFESGRAVMTSAVYQRLDLLVNDLKGKRNTKIKIIGHTDDQRVSKKLQSTFANNNVLSEARALTVAGYLKTRLNLEASQLTIIGKGESSPVADNKTEDGRAANRRVEIFVWYEELAKPLTKMDEKSLCGEADINADVPFNITIDGVPDEPSKTRVEADRQRCADVALEKADIRIHYDPLAIAPALNVWTTPNGSLRAEQVYFYTYSNYAFWIKRAEVRIFEKGNSSQQKPYAVLPVKLNGNVSWQSPGNAPDKLFFLLRVYDDKGRFDETAAKELTLLTVSKPHKDEENKARESLVGYGENSKVLANIPVYGGNVTIDGAKIKEGQIVTALGLQVPVDKNGKFAVRQIMPAGPHSIEVSVTDKQGQGVIYRRNVSIPDTDWFYIAIADLTVGQNSTSGPAKLVTTDTSDYYDNKTYIDGRGAFYLKGKIKGEYLLTASADTRERPLKDLFSNFDSKDPSYLLRRINPDMYYPVYGDDSTIVDDAPTQGKFYVKLEKGDSSIMWGNFQTQWTGTELTQYSRGLYGANLLIRPDATTKYGERTTFLNAFAAEPGTISSREEFRGTGGSLYYLQHLDITQGSESIWVEIRDKDSLMVLERRQLSPAQDYDINYLQGRVVLRSPLPSVADGSALVQTSILNGNPVFLVATYEYVPGMSAVNDLAGGLRATHWINDYIRLGITGFRQGEDQSAQRLEGADLILRYKPGTYIKGEFAHSDGAGVGTQTSITGGFGFNALQGTDNDTANAWRIESALDMSELWEGKKGKMSSYWQNRQRGFSGPGQVTLSGERMEQIGAAASLPIGERTTFDLKADYRDSDSQLFRVVEGSIGYRVTDSVKVSTGVRADDRKVAVANASPTLSQDGERTDAIVRIDYRQVAKKQTAAVADDKAVADAQKTPVQTATQSGADNAPPEKPAQPVAEATPATPQKNDAPPVVQYEPWGIFTYGQKTINHSGARPENDRVGVGADWQATSRFKIGGEVSTGGEGLGGKLTGDYRIDDRSNVYLTYVNETESQDIVSRGRIGTLVFGSGYKMSDQARIYTESRWVDGAGPNSLAQAFGLDLAPNDRWTFGIKGEVGKVSDELAGDLKRYAGGLSAAYKFQKIKYATAIEYRRDNGTMENRDTWLMKNSFGYQATPSWRLIGKFNFSRSFSTLGSFYDGNYTEIVTGAALRPVTHDRLNMLFKYTYFENVPSPGQLTPTALVADYSQRSHVLSADAIYDLVKWLSIGAKYGLRLGELKMTKTDGEWFSSRADLIILRADLHLVREWDMILEARRLKVYEADDERSGALIGVYRHITDNFKIGAGYNFTDFSDNLTDLSYSSHGWFINAIASF
jgi:outer membrane protein OmpA-like peptidoglycan-associated protein